LAEIASSYKVTYPREKLEAYLRNELIMPATLELDITTNCTKKCELCPSTRSPRSSTLDLGFIENLFAALKGETKGLLLSGGEPTLAPTFPEVLRLGQTHGFSEIAIVTNGNLLDEEKVSDALCRYASAVRVSIYNWTTQNRGEIVSTFERIKRLRSRIDREGSGLQIGVSALTSKENADAIPSIIREVASTGAHWIYFHPLCSRWETGAPERVDQSGVLEKIEQYKRDNSDFPVFTYADRYVKRSIGFSSYHGAHFLLVIGADGKNYLGAEVKYHPQYVVADLNNWDDDFLWRQERLRRIHSVSSRTYSGMGSRHRGVMYSHIIQNLIDQNERSLQKSSTERYVFPHIL